MEALKLTQQEQVFYGDLFQNCDADGNGKITGNRASELFMFSGLNQDILLQISELCGAKRLGHFGRSQFYIALKLIAAVQNGLPPKLDSINAGMEMPLPKFSRGTEAERRHVQQNSLPTQDNERPVLIPPTVSQPQQALGQLPPPPASSKKSHTRSQSGQFRGLVERDSATLTVNVATALTQSAQSPQISSTTLSQPAQSQQVVNREESPNNTASPQQFSPLPKSPPSSPVTSNVQNTSSIPLTNHNSVHTNMASPVGKTVPVINNATSAPSVISGGAPTVITGTAPTNIHTGPHGGSFNSTHDHGAGWASFEEDERAGLLMPGSKKSFNLEPPGFDSSSISSDPESVDDVWSINDEQRDYYMKQFQTMQPDPSGVIIGGIAKDFFEKSKLPVHELSKIWQLSDLNRDGALSLDEFCIAMHLVVLRRNEIELPERLPFSLMPYTSFTNEEPFAADLPKGSTLKRATPPETPPSQTQSINENFEPLVLDGSSDTASEVASPSIKPLNFASMPVSSDPDTNIVHPIAMKVSPDSKRETRKDGSERGRAFSEPGPSHIEQVQKLRSKTESILNSSQNDLDLLTGDDEVLSGSSVHLPPPPSSRPRPVPNKKASVPGNITGLLIPAPSSSHNENSEGDQEPPLPPPRPTHTTYRSMSVDKGLSTPPAVPPRTSPKDSPALRKSADGVTFSAINSKFTDFKKFESIPSASEESLNISSTDQIDTDMMMNGQLGPVQTSAGLESGDAGLVQVDRSIDSSPLVKFDIPEDSEFGGGEKQTMTVEMKRQLSRDKKDLQMAIRTHKERNSMLERLGSELNQELQEVMEQRIALEIQLEHLKPFSS